VPSGALSVGGGGIVFAKHASLAADQAIVGRWRKRAITIFVILVAMSVQVWLPRTWILIMATPYWDAALLSSP